MQVALTGLRIVSERSTNAIKGKVCTNCIRTLPLSLLRHKLTRQCTHLPGGSKFGISQSPQLFPIGSVSNDDGAGKKNVP